MLRRHNQLITSYLLAIDIIVVSIAWGLSYLLRFYSSLIPLVQGIPPFKNYLSFMLFVIIIWTIIFKAFKTQKVFQKRSMIDDFCETLKISTVSVLLLIATTFFYREHSYSRIVMLLFWINSSILLTLSHLIIKKIVQKIRSKGYLIHKVLIVGAGHLGKSLAEKFKKYPEIGVKVIGFLTDHKDKIGLSYEGVPVLDSIDCLKDIVELEKPDELFVALPLGSHQRLEKVIQSLDEETIDIKVVPDLYRYMRLNGGIEDLDGLPIINLSEGPMWGWNKIVKRILDIIFSFFAIIISSPLIIFISLFIKITSRGPILYIQERMGIDGRRFTIYKFRSMPINVEEETGAVWAKKGDKRATKIGSLLRRTSLDELPQFFNVLKGDMSFVGPRPERPIFVEKFKKSIPLYMLRHKVKTGITGWAQVNGWRGDTSLKKRIEYDIYYIENWSLKFDIKIIWLTIWKGLIGKNAY